MAFRIKHEKFEGPLELLLELIEKEKLSISEISLAKVTDEYITYIKSLGKIDPEQLAEFLVIAAQLMLIKSRSLLPGLVLSEEETQSIEELEKRLEEYKRLRELSKEIKNLEAGRHFIFTREAYFGMAPVFYPPTKTTAALIRDVFSAFLASLPKIEKLAEEKLKKIISLEEKIKQIRSFLQETVERAFSELTKGAKEKVEIIVSFLAILELARQRFVELNQKKPFEDIIIKRVLL
ncbi:MAG: segregation/condensation protein A [Candidatus Sungiibacteriota bacterium]|uniref:Segregation and condensation protein A n=1 Tax=Candidatus Sungiibacteriota bacterium TaxID=2750080 RepID=A0A7T5RJL5_9BACT|nr:MAG: segregation/condensation protein A [Candidatus Sungbacteria bacterium]